MTTRGRLNQLLKRWAQPSVDVGDSRPTRTRSTHAILRSHQRQAPGITQFLHSRSDRRAGQANRPRHRADPAVPQRTRFRCRSHPTYLLIHHVAKRFVLLSNLRFVVTHVFMLSSSLTLVKRIS